MNKHVPECFQHLFNRLKNMTPEMLFKMPLHSLSYNDIHNTGRLSASRPIYIYTVPSRFFRVAAIRSCVLRCRLFELQPIFVRIGRLRNEIG